MYPVTVSDANTFTVTDTASGSITGSPAAVMYANVLMEADSYNPTAYTIVVPGEGILAPDGIYVGLVANVTATVFYG
jgi:hypothetical protein